jgi:uncharacterized membrane protein
MSDTKRGSYLQIVGVGAIAGMRSMSAPMLVTRYLAGGGRSQPLVWPGMPLLAGLFTLAGLSEMVIDKLPFLPDRTEPSSVAGRVGSGMFAGALLAAAGGRPRVTGAILGGLAAFLSTYGFYHLRRWAVQKSQLPDPLIAAAEDALAQALGYGLLTS